MGTDSESPIRFFDKKDEVIEAGAKAIIKTEDIINNAKPHGDASIKHTKRKNVLGKEMENIKNRKRYGTFTKRKKNGFRTFF